MQSFDILKTLPCDAVFGLYYTGYAERFVRMQPELARVGLEGRVQAIWQFPTPYDKWEMDHLPHVQFLAHQNGVGIWSASKANYAAIKSAYSLGCQRLFIVEDDCRFMKDLDYVKTALENIPPDWDVLMLDHFLMLGEMGRPNQYWTKCIGSGSTACYIMNRKAMERFIRMYESAVKGNYRKPLLRACDQWTDIRYLGNDINLYCATPNLAVQCTMPGPSNCGRLHCEPKYRTLGVDLKNYMEY